jgi:hypothetical protein
VDGDSLFLCPNHFFGDEFHVLQIDVSNGKSLRHFSMPRSEMVGSLAVSRSGSMLATLAVVGSQRNIYVFDTLTGKLRTRLDERADRFYFSPQGGSLLAIEGDRGGQSIVAWDIEKGQQLKWDASGHEQPILDLAFSANGKRLITGSIDAPAVSVELRGRADPPQRSSEALIPILGADLWRDLAGEDPLRAFVAVDILSVGGAKSVQLIRERVSPVPAVGVQRIDRLIAELDSSRYTVRQQASAELKRLGELALPHLRRALRGTPSLEMRRRLEALTNRPYYYSPDERGALRAVEILEHIGTTEARQALAYLAKGAPEARLTRAARIALLRLPAVQQADDPFAE